MLSVVKLAGTDQRYFLEQAGVRLDKVESVSSGIEDYYLSGPEASGGWTGSGARLLGLTGPVDDKALRGVLDRRDPRTDDLLPGPVQRARLPGYDFMFSVPKSASILFGLGDPSQQRAVLIAQDRAVRAALAYLERYACRARLGHGGAEVIDGAGFVGAAFRHRTSRAGDPQVHTHVLVANATRRPDGQWGTLDGRAVFAHARTAGYVHEAVFRQELSRELGVEWGIVKKGIADVRGVPQAVIRAFSRRRAEVEAKVAEWGRDGLAARQAAAQMTRARKDYEVTPDTLVPEWRRRAAEFGLGEDALLRLPCSEALELDVGIRRYTVERLVGPDGLTAQRSTFDRRDVMRAVAESRRGGASLDELESLCDQVLAHPNVVELPLARAPLITRRDGRRVIGQGTLSRYTTAELLGVELRAIEGVAERQAEQAGVADADAVEASLERRSSIGVDQASMVRRLCEDGNGVTIVVGPPGTGKTYALDAAREAWQSSGYAVHGAAVARRAARALQDGAGIDSTSVTALLKDLDRTPTLNARTVLVIDEAGMVGTRQLARILEHSARAGSKVVLVGDPHQLPEIDAGGAFAALARSESAITLEVNRRQQREHDRALLDLWREGAVDKALQLAASHGDLVMAADAETARTRLVDEYVTASLDGSDSVMVALRRADVRDLNERARARLDAAGHLGPGRLRLLWGEFASGDRVVLKRNDRRLDVSNGDFATVEAVDTVTGSMLVSVGERFVELGIDYIHAGDEPAVLHGYASTAHSLQGATVDRAFVLGSELAYREWGYTAWSRARESTRFFVCEPGIAEDVHPIHATHRSDPVDQLLVSLGESRAQSLATEGVSEGDLDRLTALAARHVASDHVVEALGHRPDEPNAARRWDRAVLQLERARRTLDIRDDRRPLGAEPSIGADDRAAWTGARRALDRARRDLRREGPARDHGRDLHR